MDERVKKRLWKYVDTSAGPKACWPWVGSKTHFGYGRFWRGGRKYENAHRSVYEAVYGELESGLVVVRHTCDNPACCNPRHLIPGSQGDNNRDTKARGRRGYTGLPGTKNHKAKLNENDVLNIRELSGNGYTCAEIARLYKVTWSTIGNVLSGRRWASVTENDRSATTVLLPEEY